VQLDTNYVVWSERVHLAVDHDLNVVATELIPGIEVVQDRIPIIHICGEAPDRGLRVVTKENRYVEIGT
jgi:hypothetical protein